MLVSRIENHTALNRGRISLVAALRGGCSSRAGSAGRMRRMTNGAGCNCHVGVLWLVVYWEGKARAA
ncbi:MAG: hypothetical protein ISS35_04820 [Kiritimatiellae bacterium]|nr:hypothetical protein [Kiritimatiellia bacterium]